MPEKLFFYLALGFILTHEMDAIRCKEWQIFPGIAMLSDSVGMVVFCLLHIPLYAWLIGGLVEGENPERLMQGLDIFFMVHVGLHLLFLKHPKNQFTSWFSWTLIGGAGLFGLLDLLF